MPALPCTNHPNETTYVRCGRCDRPFCVRCLVDTPVGKKCRECSQNRTHLEEATAGQVGLAFLGALVVGLPAGWILQQFPTLFVLAAPYGYLVAEAALRTGGQRRSMAVQVVTGLAAFMGCVVGAALVIPPAGATGPGAGLGFQIARAIHPFSILATAIGVGVAVSRVRYL